MVEGALPVCVLYQRKHDRVRGVVWDPALGGSTTGMYLARHRWFSPELGRWVTKDPVGYGAGDMNLYGYVGGMPTEAIDPMGLLTSLRPEGVATAVTMNMSTRDAVLYLAAQGMSYEAIAKALGITAATVAGIVGTAAVVEKAKDVACKPVKGSAAQPAAGTPPPIDPNWGWWRIVKELTKEGWKFMRQTDAPGGRMYTNPQTGDRIRLIPGYKRLPPNANPVKRGPYWRFWRRGDDWMDPQPIKPTPNAPNMN